MELTPVESSNVAAVGYLASDQVLLVRYKDGALYAWRDFNTAMWASMEAAPSKGAWLGAQRNGVLITKGGNAGNPIIPEQGVATAESATPLNTIDPDAATCCTASLRRLFAGGTSGKLYFDCHDCGTRFKPAMVGPVRHWSIVAMFATVGRKR